MLFHKVLAPSLTCLLLLLTLFPDVQSRRGAGGRWGGAGRTGVGWGGANRGGHQNHKAPHVHTGSSSSGSNAGKIAGAAAAGALGGMVLGHGLSSMARPGYGHGGYGGYGHGHPRHNGHENGHENGHRHHVDRADGVFRNETDMEYYVGNSSKGQTSGCVLLFGAVVLFYLWSS